MAELKDFSDWFEAHFRDWYKSYYDDIVDGKMHFFYPYHFHRAFGSPGFYVIENNTGKWLGHMTEYGDSKLPINDEIFAAFVKQSKENEVKMPDPFPSPKKEANV